MIDRSEVWKEYIRQFENCCCDNQTMIVPVQHVSLSDNKPCTPALTAHSCTLMVILRPYVSVGKNRSLVCTLLFVLVMVMNHVAGIN